MAKADQLVSIRVPAGLPNELRALYGMPFSKLMRQAALQLKNKAIEAEQNKNTGDAK